MKVSYTEEVTETTRKRVEKVKEVKGCYECPYFRRFRDTDLFYDPFCDTYKYYCGKKKGLCLGVLNFGAGVDEYEKQRKVFGEISKECPLNE